MSEINSSYQPTEVENTWYKTWEEQGIFHGKINPDQEAYSIVIPPPNVTGVLHMGHILNNTIQDYLARHARQEGKSVMWLPGTDHAGIATQTRVEKELRKEGKTRHDLGREKFVEKIVEWKDEHGGIILQQLKKLGASCDWSRTKFTLDEDYSEAVLTAFVDLFKKGYIYRGKRMVNWCPVSQTALSDEEVIMKPQQGTLYKMRYEIVDGDGEFLEISTTRPETIMGDSAVAVHPDDERYQKYIGKHCWRPFPREPIPIVADSAVEKDFGTGVLKVTPAHDKADWDIGQRNQLAVIDVMNPDGTMNELAGEFAGMERFAARKAAANKLEEMGLLIEREKYENNVGFSERADVPIEPRLSEQWFLKYPKVEEATQVVRDGTIKFYPERWTKTYLHWLDNIQDWCISRQLWWGHRIPVWYKKGEDRTNPENWHVSVEGPSDPENWEQDDDVLDTWASSWLWPFATMGWPKDGDSSKDLAYWYPTGDLVTGPDIIFFWVARMIMAGLEFMEDRPDLESKIPFQNVFFTGIIRDEKGRKMSKSLGNSPDPLDLIEKYGADGLRFGILSIAPQGQDVLFNEERVEQGRNFCNKLWNACRFRQMSGDKAVTPDLASCIQHLDASKLDLHDEALLLGVIKATEQVDKFLSLYQFNSAIQETYGLFWNQLCDWYLEISKSKLKNEETKASCLAVQDFAIRQILLLLHPITPFITEELWHKLGFAGSAEDSIQTTYRPKSDDLRAALNEAGISLSEDAATKTESLRTFTTQARALKAQYKLQNKKDCSFSLYSEHEQLVSSEELQELYKLVGAKEITVLDRASDLASAVVTPLGTLYLDLSDAIDVAAEKARFQKEVDKLEKVIKSTEARLQNEKFTASAPQNVIDGAKKQLAENQEKREEVLRIIASLG